MKPVLFFCWFALLSSFTFESPTHEEKERVYFLKILGVWENENLELEVKYESDYLYTFTFKAKNSTETISTNRLSDSSLVHLDSASYNVHIFTQNNKNYLDITLDPKGQRTFPFEDVSSPLHRVYQINFSNFFDTFELREIDPFFEQRYVEMVESQGISEEMIILDFEKKEEGNHVTSDSKKVSSFINMVQGAFLEKVAEFHRP